MARKTTPRVLPPHVIEMPTRQLQEIVYRNNPELRCRVLPPDKFFESRNTEFARSLCTGCPIIDECGELAIREEMRGYLQGVRGGMSPSDRRAIVRSRKKEAE